MASPNCDQHLSTNSQFVRWQYESYIIVHHCLVYSMVFLSKTLFSQSELFSPREKPPSLWKLRHVVWRVGCTWAFRRHPEWLGRDRSYRRRLDWHEKISRLDSWYLERSSGVAWIWVAQDSCGNRIKQSQNQEDLDIVVLYQLQHWKALELRGGYHRHIVLSHISLHLLELGNGIPIFLWDHLALQNKQRQNKTIKDKTHGNTQTMISNIHEPIQHFMISLMLQIMT